MDEIIAPQHDLYSEYDEEQERHSYMRMALSVGKAALEIGEVPVGCVIVLRLENGESVVVSHGANQVNCTRDATRHAELVAIDRMLTGGQSSDVLRLSAEIVAKSAHGKVPTNSPLLLEDKLGDVLRDRWVNVPHDPTHWKNTYGWGTGRIFSQDIFPQCDLYVTCEPCIMCAAALAKIHIGRVFFACHNERFGGCGSLMSLQKPDALPTASHIGYPIVSGILQNEAVGLLRSFYERENFHAPDEKRKKKEHQQDLVGTEDATPSSDQPSKTTSTTI